MYVFQFYIHQSMILRAVNCLQNDGIQHRTLGNSPSFNLIYVTYVWAVHCVKANRIFVVTIVTIIPELFRLLCTVTRTVLCWILSKNRTNLVVCHYFASIIDFNFRTTCQTNSKVRGLKSYYYALFDCDDGIDELLSCSWWVLWHQTKVPCRAWDKSNPCSLGFSSWTNAISLLQRTTVFPQTQNCFVRFSFGGIGKILWNSA